MTRFDRVAALLRRLDGVFACPVCEAPLAVGADGGCLLCGCRHSFDLAIYGYVNLLLSTQRKSRLPGYTADVLRARRAVLDQGFFAPMIRKVAARVIQRLQARPSGDPALILDAGCGEGYVTSAVAARLREKLGRAVDAVGLDISKEGIRIAARHDHSVAWCVANIARRLPFVTGKFDALTNVLSPANPPEFHRVLRPDGTLVKVVPMDNHLVELREALYERREEGGRTTEKSVAELAPWFDVTGAERLNYAVLLHEEARRDVVKMSPLFWKAKKDRLASLQQTGIDRVRVDLLVITATAR